MKNTIKSDSPETQKQYKTEARFDYFTNKKIMSLSKFNKIALKKLMKDDTYLSLAVNDYLQAQRNSNSAIITIKHILSMKYAVNADMDLIEDLLR